MAWMDKNAPRVLAELMSSDERIYISLHLSEDRPIVGAFKGDWAEVEKDVIRHETIVDTPTEFLMPDGTWFSV